MPDGAFCGEAAPTPKLARRLATALWRGLGRFLRRPDAPRWIATAVLAAIAVFSPGYVISLIAITVAIGVITWFTLGPDRVVELVVAWHDRLRARDPERATAIQQKAAQASRRLAALLARLPERWTDQLYLPDFEDAPARPAKLDDDPFERLAAEVRAGDAAGNR